MELLKELLHIGDAVLSEANKPTSVKVPALAPRNKQLNDVLRTRKGGKHYDARSDYVRAKEKVKIRSAMEDEEQS